MYYEATLTEEDIAIVRRRTQAIGMIVLGILVAAFGVAAFITGMFGIPVRGRQTTIGEQYGTGAAVGAVLVPVGFGLVIYGSYYFEKVRHVEWTKQALREYNQARYGAIGSGQLSSAPSSTLEHNQLPKFCIECGKSFSVPVEYCSYCGAKVGGTSKQLEIQRQTALRFLAKLDKRYERGEVDETTYQELKTRYQLRLEELSERELETKGRMKEGKYPISSADMEEGKQAQVRSSTEGVRLEKGLCERCANRMGHDQCAADMLVIPENKTACSSFKEKEL